MTNTGVLGPSMFETLNTNIAAITPDKMREAYNKAATHSKVVFKGFHVNLFLLNDAEQIKQYETLMNTLISGIPLFTHVMFNYNKQFVPYKATWLVIVEWGEYELVDKKLTGE